MIFTLTPPQKNTSSKRHYPYIKIVDVKFLKKAKEERVGRPTAINWFN